MGAIVETGPDTPPAVIYALPEHEKLMANIGDAYRWIAEAMAQLNYYRGRE